MKCAAEMGSGAMMCIPRFKKLVQAFKSCCRGYTNRHTGSKEFS
jgi:hypothetical protein